METTRLRTDYERLVLPLYENHLSKQPAPLNLDCLGMEKCSAWQEALSLLPDDREIWLSLANHVFLDQRAGESLALYRVMETLFPYDADIVHNIGIILQLADDRSSAAAQFEQALVLNPDRLDSALPLAQLLAQQDPQKALALLDRFPSSEPMTFTRGLTHLISQLSLPEASKIAALNSFVETLATSCDLNQHTKLVETLFQTNQVQQALHVLNNPPPCENEWQVLIRRFALLNKYLPSQTDTIDALRLELVNQYKEIPQVNQALSEVARSNYQYKHAIDLAKLALEQHPSSITIMSLVAANHLSLGQHREAQSLLKRCLAANNMQAEIHEMLGYSAFATGDIDLSRASLLNSLRLRARAGRNWLHLSQALYLHSSPAESLTAASKACEANPEDQNARTTRGIIHLLLGNYSSGWPDYEYRIHQQIACIHPPSNLDRWDGLTELDDLVLVSEQGAGDLVQFLRYVPFLRLSIPRVSILVPKRLQSLMELADVFSAVYCYGDSIPIHGKGAWLPFMSIAGLLGVSTECVLIDEPYLHAPAAALDQWRRILREDDTHRNGKIIGIHWQGNPATEVSMFAGRSFALEHLAPLAELPGFTFLSLQKGAGSEQLSVCSFRDRFAAAQTEVDACWDYAENSAILSLCDLVITSDSGIAHLAGALGRPVWLLLAKTPEWRWGLTGERTAWYPTMRVFRQKQAGDWNPVIESVKAALAEE